jgi:hypothetical protein
MAADNDLWDVALIDLEEMKEGYKETGVNLIVLLDIAGEAPCLLKITEDGEQTIKTYQEFNSSDPANMHKLPGEIAAMYPSGIFKSSLPQYVEVQESDACERRGTGDRFRLFCRRCILLQYKNLIFT